MIKRDGAGNVQQFKARLIFGGNDQIKGIDDQDTHAPTAHLGSGWLAVTITAKNDLGIHQLDVWMVLLVVELEEEISMHPLQGYVCLPQNGSRYNDPRLTKTSCRLVLHWRRSLYGLKHSSHVWYATFKDLLIWIGLLAVQCNKGLFLHHNTDQCVAIAAVILYVDDLVINADAGLFVQIMDHMRKRFWMHDLGSVSVDLGMTIELNQMHHMINIHHHCYIRTMLEEFRMDASRVVAMPIVIILHKKKPEEEASDLTKYRSMFGSLVQPMTATQPNITFAIRVLNWYYHDPSYEQMIAFKHLFRYLNGG